MNPNLINLIINLVLAVITGFLSTKTLEREILTG